MIYKLFLGLICGLPFGHLCFRKLNVWMGQGHFFQLGLLFLFCCSLIERPKEVRITNKPLTVFFLWAGLVTAYLWFYVVSETKNYPVKLFLPFFNFLCFILFYQLSIQYLDKIKIEKIFRYFKYSIWLVLFYCVLQFFSLDQFFSALGGVKKDELVGTIGNSSHLSGYLSLCQVFFFDKGLFNYLCLILLWLIIFLCNSSSGVIVGLSVVMFYLLMKRKYIYFSVLSFLCVIGTFFVNFKFFTFSNRIELWQILLDKIKIKAITGSGLGMMNVLRLKDAITGSTWRHAHNEYFQVTAELGIIGVLLVLWCIWEYFRLFKTFKNDLTIKLADIFFGFCLLGLFTFPAHLWLISCLGMISYSWVYVLKNEEILNGT